MQRRSNAKVFARRCTSIPRSGGRTGMADEPIEGAVPQGGEAGAPEAEAPSGMEEGESKATKESAPEIPSVLPLLPVRDIVIFPYMTLPLFVGREASIAAVDEALGRDRDIFLATQKDPPLEEPEAGGA